MEKWIADAQAFAAKQEKAQQCWDYIEECRKEIARGVNYVEQAECGVIMAAMYERGMQLQAIENGYPVVEGGK